MTYKQTATTIVRATEIFNDFFKRDPDMHDTNDVMELLCIHADVMYTMQNMQMRSEKAD